MFDSEFLRILKDPVQTEILNSAYVKAEPFPHIIFDKVFDFNYEWKLYANFPRPDASWWKYDNVLERKYAKDDLHNEHVCFQEAIGYLHSKLFVTFLERLTGIQGLIVDHSLRGGGLHQITTGGKLDVHADYNLHPATKLDRRVNVLLYLNPGWKESWGGSLELWDKDMSRAIKSIIPSMGRMVVFSTKSDTYHGHPDALTCPEGVTRKSIALYYYTNGRPESERTDSHSTIYKARPQDINDRETQELREKRAKGRLQ